MSALVNLRLTKRAYKDKSSFGIKLEFSQGLLHIFGTKDFSTGKVGHYLASCLNRAALKNMNLVWKQLSLYAVHPVRHLFQQCGRRKLLLQRHPAVVVSQDVAVTVQTQEDEI